MVHKSGKYIIYILLGIGVLLLFINFIVSFIFSLFLIMIFLSSGGYGSPEGKWQAYTTGMGNWRIGGIAARNEDYSRTLKAEIAESKNIPSGSIYIVIIILIILISIIGLIFGYGSILNFF